MTDSCITEFKSKTKTYLETLIRLLIKKECPSKMQLHFESIIKYFEEYLEKDFTSSLNTCRKVVESCLKFFFPTEIQKNLMTAEMAISKLNIEMLQHHVHFVRCFGNLDSHECKFMGDYELIAVISSTVCILELLINHHEKILPKKVVKKEFKVNENGKEDTMNDNGKTITKSPQTIPIVFGNFVQVQKPVNSAPNDVVIMPNQFKKNEFVPNSVQQKLIGKQDSNSKDNGEVNNKTVMKEIRGLLGSEPYYMKKNVLFQNLSEKSQNFVNNNFKGFDHFLKLFNDVELESDFVKNCKIFVVGTSFLKDDVELNNYFTKNCGKVNFCQGRENTAVVSFDSFESFEKALSLKKDKLKVKPYE
jgi:hypothetical protein